MTSLLQSIGAWVLHLLQRFGRLGCLWGAIITRSWSLKGLGGQVYAIGVLSLSIVVVSGLFIGAVLGLQGYYTLSRFGATEALGQLLALSILRELGPVVTALLFAGRALSAVTSEIGLMKTTEQLLAMRMMGVDPIQRVIAPRYWAGVISLPLLTLVFSAVAIIGGYWVDVSWLGVSSGPFWANMQASVSFMDDLVNGMIKSVVFGGVTTWIAMYQGYYCEQTSAGIASATTKTVVYASLAILGLDFFLTAVMFK